MTQPIKHTILTLLVCLVILLTGSYNTCPAQGSNVFNKVSLAESLKVSFTKGDIEIDKGQVISNVLRVYNSSDQDVNIYISLNYPPQWKSLFNSNKLYSIAANDTLYVPVRIIPATLMKGDTKYFINAYIEDEERRAVSSEYFFASTERLSEWEISVNPDRRVYFKNNENLADVDVNLLNKGNEKQDMLFTVSTANSNILIMDSTEKPINKFEHDLSLNPEEDTTFSYKIKHIEGERNFKSIDIENYNPGTLNDEKHFSIFYNSEEPRREKYNNTSRSAKVDFVKLSNDKKINPYGSDVLPLSAYLRVSNLMDDVVFSSLHLRGQKYFNNGGQLLYNTSFYFSSQENFYDENYGRNIPWYVGYFDANKNLQMGYVNGGAIGVQSSGKGIKGEIKFLPHHWAGAYYVKSPYFFSGNRLESYGLHHRMEYTNFSNETRYSRSHHKYAKIITDVLSVNPRLRLFKKHTITFTGALSNRYNYMRADSTYAKQGYLAGLGYSSSFFDNIWRLNLRGTYTSKGFGANGYERVYANHRSRIRVSQNLDVSVLNNYNQYNYDNEFYNYRPGYDKNYYFYNSINFYSSKYLGSFKPGVFYDIRNHWGYNFHSRGLNLSYNKYNVTKNLQVSLINTLGLVRIVNLPGSKEHFNYKFNTMVRYRSMSFTGYYNFGPLSPSMVLSKEQNNISPQTIRASFMHMYLFNNRHLALQSRASYMYTNIYSHHSLNISPELFYFTNSGWRFSINPTFTFYSSKIRINDFDFPSYIDEGNYEIQRHANDHFLISLGVKKDFGIPIPTTFNEYSDITFKAFYDLNGNKVQDEEEPGIENIVIKAGNWSVITKANGQASFENANPGRFEFDVLSLADLKGWFPMIPDTLTIYEDMEFNIPFVKGVKVYGSVFIEFEDTNTGDEKRIDKGGIKISATNGYLYSTLTGSNGNFEFYLPFGEYTISLDENILNGRYSLVKNNYKLDLTKEVENMYLTFHIVEKKRTIRVKRFGENLEEDNGEDN
jgi:hypothetical protein